MGREREREENKKKKIARVESQTKNREKWGEGGRARESLRFVEEAPIKRHATNVTAPFPARVEGGIEGHGRWKQCWEHRLKRKGGRS